MLISFCFIYIIKIGRSFNSTFEVGAVMLNREFSVKLKLPPATVDNFS